jgi:hypothetical protein
MPAVMAARNVDAQRAIDKSIRITPTSLDLALNPSCNPRIAAGIPVLPPEAYSSYLKHG